MPAFPCADTLQMVAPFVKAHSPEAFARSYFYHRQGQSEDWLAHLLPLLNNEVCPEGRQIAAFHFAMEAFIKAEQGKVAVSNRSRLPPHRRPPYRRRRRRLAPADASPRAASPVCPSQSRSRVTLRHRSSSRTCRARHARGSRSAVACAMKRRTCLQGTLSSAAAKYEQLVQGVME